MKVNMLEAKNQLSRLVKAALEGEEVIIARDGTPMVKLVPVAGKAGLVHFGKHRKLAAGVDAAFSATADASVAALLEDRK